VEAHTPVTHPEPDSGRRRNRFNWQAVGSLLISIACGLVYPLVGGGRTFWFGLGILLLVAFTFALVRFIRNTRQGQS
jgi:hypothetical protein